MTASLSPKLQTGRTELHSPPWGWKMLAVVMAALTADDILRTAGTPVSIRSMATAFFGLLASIGIAEYAFQKRSLPLAIWRAFLPIYAVEIAYGVGQQMGATYAGGGLANFHLMTILSALVVLAASLVAVARRAQYLGPDRIPLGGRKPSLT